MKALLWHSEGAAALKFDQIKTIFDELFVKEKYFGLGENKSRVVMICNCVYEREL
jgi:hypothetical protein